VEKQLEDQEQEANNAITGWQESYAESDSKCTKLEKELETVREEKDSLATASETIEEDNNELEKEKFALEERVSSLENSIARENVPIEPQYKEREVLEVQLREKEEALHEAQETLQRDADIVNQWEGKCYISLEKKLSENFVVSRQSSSYMNVERGAELELAAKELKAQLEQQVEEANDAIFRWEETYTELEGKYSQLEQDLTKAGSADGKEVELLKQVERLSEKLKEAEQQASRAEEERQSMSKSWSTSEITIQMLQDDIESREESIKRLNAEVENVKSKRDESIERLNAEIDVARSELEKNLRSTTAEYTGIQTDLEKSKAEFVTVTDLIETERNSHLFEKEQLTGELDDEKARYTDARDEVANLTKKMEEIISENFVVSRQSLSERDEAIERLNAEIDIARSELEKLRSTNAKYTGIQADLEKSKAEVVAITDLLETERNSHLFEKEQLASELDDEKARYTEARDEVANLTKEVEEIRIESEDIVNQWTGKFDPSSQVYLCSLLIIS
jgi:chromosome segregation ATPase